MELEIINSSYNPISIPEKIIPATTPPPPEPVENSNPQTLIDIIA